MEATDYYDERADWSLIPRHMHNAIADYVMHGIPPGSFLKAVLSNDLADAFARADDTNAANMHGWIRFLYNFAPGGCSGSPEAFQAWIKRGGLLGVVAKVVAQ